MRPMQAGKMRHRVQFQSASAGPNDASGQPSQNWEMYYSCWAKITELRAQMIYQTDSFIAQSTYTIEIRYPGTSVSISAQDRAVDDDGVVYVIDAPVDTERRHRKVEVLCHVLNEAD